MSNEKPTFNVNEKPEYNISDGDDPKKLTPEEYAELLKKLESMSSEQQSELFKKMTGKDPEETAQYGWTPWPENKDK